MLCDTEQGVCDVDYLDKNHHATSCFLPQHFNNFVNNIAQHQQLFILLNFLSPPSKIFCGNNIVIL